MPNIHHFWLLLHYTSSRSRRVQARKHYARGIFTYLGRARSTSVSFSIHLFRGLAHYYFPVMLERAFFIRVDAAVYLRATLRDSPPSIRGKGKKRSATTPHPGYNILIRDKGY